MNTNVYRLDQFDIRFTDARVTLGPQLFFRLLPPAHVILGALQLLTGVAMLGVSAGLIIEAGVELAVVVPVLTLALVLAHLAVALDSGLVWGLLVAGAQWLVLAPAGYLMATNRIGLAGVLLVHLVAVLMQLVDLRAFRQMPVRVWLGAELGLLFLLALW